MVWFASIFSSSLAICTLLSAAPYHQVLLVCQIGVTLRIGLEWLLVVAVIYLILLMIGYGIIRHFFAFRFLISCDKIDCQLRDAGMIVVLLGNPKWWPMSQGTQSVGFC